MSVAVDGVSNLRSAIRGNALVPGDPTYDAARTVWNALIDKRPALIVQSMGAADVIAAVRFAQDTGLELAVRGGGHNVAGRSVPDGGLLLDLSPMKGLRGDPVRRTARAQPGLRLGEFDRETQAFGLATTLGIASDTGIAGLTLGGGYGWLNGKHGLACDNVVSADIVLRDGRLVTASATEHPDLFWAVRGAGANFGVVTSFEYQLHPLGPVLAGAVFYPVDRAAAVLRFYHEWSSAAPDALSTACLLASLPDGTPAAVIAACYSGAIEEGERVLKPLRSVATPLVDLVAPCSYLQIQSLFDGPFAPGQRAYWKTSLMRAPNEAANDVMVEYARKRPGPGCAIYLQQLHGAAARVAPDATAFPHRFYHYDCGPLPIWQDPRDTEASIAWARDCWTALRPYYEPNVYVNALSDDADDAARVRAAYGPNFDRLLALKTKYDPTNLFHSTGNIRPNAAS